MNCHEARDLCSALLDDALSADERTVLQGHLDGCAECRRELDRLRQTVALLGGMAPARAPAGFVDRVLAARPEPWYRRALRALSLPFRVRLPLEAAALLLVGGLAVYVFQHSPELQRAARNESPPAAPTTPSPPAEGRPSASVPAAPAPKTAVDRAASDRSGPPPAAPPPAPGAPAQQPSPVVGAKESQSAGRVADIRQGAAGEVGKTKNAEPSEEDRWRAASGSGEREQKKIGARADQSSAPPAASGSARPVPAAPSAGEGARKATPPAAPPPAASVAESAAAESSRNEPAAQPLARPKAGEPTLRRRQEIAAQSAPAPQGGADVGAVLSASDRDAALRGLADLVARAQGRELARRPEADGTVVDLLIPRAAYAEFTQGLGRLGQVAVSFQASTLPDEVRVSVRVRH